MKRQLLPVEVIKRTRDQKALSRDEIFDFINSYTQGEIPDYQMGAWLMAVVCRGLTEIETLHLTEAMLQSGSTLNLSSIQKPKIDKHSTGGIGDKTSLILGPIVAAAGIAVPMMSGRGLGHTGGTLDKLESIPGFNTQISIPDYEGLLKKWGIGFIGQTKEICPADKKIYALRDVTGTVESLELISASIMSKKLAESLDGLVLDVKFGSGAFMKTLDQARALALSLSKIGKGAKKKVTALLTNMNQPLGAYIGNSLESFESIEILKNKSLFNTYGIDLYEDTRHLSLTLAAHMIHLGGKANSVELGFQQAQDLLESGAAFNVFQEVCKAQGGDLEKLPRAESSLEVKAGNDGYLTSIDTERIGMLAIQLGAGRSKLTDSLDFTAGFKIHHKIGEKISSNDTLWTIYGSNQSRIESVSEQLPAATQISTSPPVRFELVKEIIY